MKEKKYYRLTTFQQRKLLIETYLKTKNITKSCQTACVAINTFRRWFPRYVENGWEGIKNIRPHTNKKLGKIEQKYKELVIELKKKHPHWGRRTIANFICNKNNGKKIISPSGVQKVLEKGGLWKK